MPEVFRIYTQDNCVWCDRAKALLKEKGFPFLELQARDNREYLRSLGCKTVPQVFLGDRHIGGFTNLEEFLRDGTVPN